MVKPKVKRQETKKSRVKKQSEVDDEDLSSLEVNCCIPTGNKHCKWTQKKDLFGVIIEVVDCFSSGFDCQQPEVAVSLESCVKLKCSLPACPLSGLLHQRCFHRLEAQGVSALANCKGRARDWTTREREKVASHQTLTWNENRVFLEPVAWSWLRVDLQDVPVSVWPRVSQEGGGGGHHQ